MFAAELQLGLRDFDLELEIEVGAGETLALVGPSGSGKSATIESIAGVRHPGRGCVGLGSEVWFDSSRKIDLPPEERSSGVVFQDYALFDHMNVWRNVAFGLRRVPRSSRRRVAIEQLDRFGIANLADAGPRSLSGGERQRVALARALAVEPSLLLLDEPLAALDASTRASATLELGGAVESSGLPTVLVTHDFVEAATLAGAIAVIERGRIIQRGTAGELAAQPASEFVAAVTGAFLLDGEVIASDGGSTQVRLPSGASLTSTDPAARGPASVSIHPWEIALEPPDSAAHGSQRNRLAARVSSLTPLGGRVRVGLDAGQTLVAEVTPESVSSLGLKPGSRVDAVWKAAATRIVASSGRLP